MNKRFLDRYFKTLSKKLPCDKKQKQRILSDLRISAEHWIETNPGRGESAFLESFGSAESVAKSYIDQMDAVEASNKILPRKRMWIICVILGALLALAILLLCGAQRIYHNYCFGQELYTQVNQVQTKASLFASSIHYLEEEFNNPNVDPSNVQTWGFDSSLLEIRFFGYENMPLLDEVRLQYTSQFEEIFKETSQPGGSKDRSNAAYLRLFTDPEESQMMDELKRQLEYMVTVFSEFTAQYNEMSVLERCFTSWENERLRMSKLLH